MSSGLPPGSAGGSSHAPPPVLTLRRQIEDYLEELVFSREPLTAPLTVAMRYSLLGGGRRIRPMLALATADALGHPPASVLPLAAALEMVHTHSLVHDDLPAINDTILRREKPSAHLAFREDFALLAGDALLAEAITVVFQKQEGPPERVLAAVAALSSAVVAGLPGGPSRLLAASVETVLILTGESGPSATALRRFGAQIGESHALATAALAEVPGDTSALHAVADVILAAPA